MVDYIINSKLCVNSGHEIPILGNNVGVPDQLKPLHILFA